VRLRRRISPCWCATGKEAAAVRRALAAARRLVYLSDKDSVFASPEAQDVLRWLRAVASRSTAPGARGLRHTHLHRLPLDELRVLARDDEAWERASSN
jgi:exodeoxyribonuclease V beta subunit